MWLYTFKELYLRDRMALFWIIIFPTIMYLVFSSIFSGVGKGIKLDIGIVGESKYFAEVLKNTDLDVSLRHYEDVESLKRAVENADVDLGIVLKNFDRDLMFSIMTGGRRKAEVEIFYRSEDEVSSIGAEVMKGVFENADVEILKVLGRVKGVKIVYEGTKGKETDPYLPVGMTLAILGAGILGVSFGNSHLEKRKITKLLRTTPIERIDMITLPAHIFALAISVFSVLAIGFVLKRVETVNWISLMIWIAIGSVTFISIGTMTSFFGELLTNLVYFSMMFTGGIFFPVSGFMKVIAWLNPTYHLNGGMSKALGLEADFTYAVPIVWMALSAAISSLLRRREGV